MKSEIFNKCKFDTDTIYGDLIIYPKDGDSEICEISSWLQEQKNNKNQFIATVSKRLNDRIPDYVDVEFLPYNSKYRFTIKNCCVFDVLSDNGMVAITLEYDTYTEDIVTEKED